MFTAQPFYLIPQSTQVGTTLLTGSIKAADTDNSDQFCTGTTNTENTIIERAVKRLKLTLFPRNRPT